MPTREDWRWFVLEILEEDQPLSWEEAFGWVHNDEAWELEDALVDLQSEGRIRHTGPRNGGYVLDDRPEMDP